MRESFLTDALLARRQEPSISPIVSRRTALTIAVIASIAGLSLARLLMTGPAFDRVWAEDGAIFYSDAVRHGVGSIGLNYGGYAGVVPRLLAQLGTAFPERIFAPYAVIASVLTQGTLAAFVQRVAWRTTGSLAASLTAAGALALAPALRGEALGNLANLQWFFLIAAAWALAMPLTSSRLAHGAAAAVGLLAALTTPLAVILIPIAFLRHGKGAGKTPANLALLVGLAIQLLLILGGGKSEANPQPRHPAMHVVEYATTFFSEAAGPAVAPWRVAMLLGAAVIVAMAVLCVRASSARFAVGIAVTGVVLFGVSSTLTGAAESRYSAVAAMFLVSAAAIAWSGKPSTLSWALLALLAVQAGLAFPAVQQRLSGPSWSQQVAACTSARTTSIAVSPAGWPLTVPCVNG